MVTPHDDEPAVPIGDGGLVRLRLDLAYDGTGFAGWAVQPGRRTVQASVQDALATLLAIPTPTLVVAGRTDAGVHAVAQVAHVDVPGEAWAPVAGTAVRRLAGLLPADVRVRAIGVVGADFSARFSALWRRYTYRLTDSDFGCEPLRRHDTVAWRRPLDDGAMHEAGRRLLGLNDYVAFCRRREGATSVREVQRLDVVRTAALIEVHIQADAFCHSMVRSVVGALLAVGDGRRPEQWPASLLATRTRAGEVVVAPAHGLTLMAIGYPPQAQFAERAALTRAVRSRDELRR